MDVMLPHVVPQYGLGQYGTAGPRSAPGFNPYVLNGGTIMAMAGDDYAVVGTDSRLSQGYMIHTRHCSKTYQLTKKTFLACAGFHGDVLTLTKNLEIRLKMYEHEHNEEMSTEAIAAMLSTMLYYRRFFPYYVYNIIGGIDSQGKGCVFSYDPVGSYEREEYRAAGTAGAILQPLLDNQIGLKNQQQYPLEAKHPSMDVTRAVALVKDVFTSAAEREIYTGDSVDIAVVKGDGTSDRLRYDLRKD